MRLFSRILEDLYQDIKEINEAYINENLLLMLKDKSNFFYCYSRKEWIYTDKEGKVRKGKGVLGLPQEYPFLDSALLRYLSIRERVIEALRLMREEDFDLERLKKVLNFEDMELKADFSILNELSACWEELKEEKGYDESRGTYEVIINDKVKLHFKFFNDNVRCQVIYKDETKAKRNFYSYDKDNFLEEIWVDLDDTIVHLEDRVVVGILLSTVRDPLYREIKAIYRPVSYWLYSRLLIALMINICKTRQ